MLNNYFAPSTGQSQPRISRSPLSLTLAVVAHHL